MTDIRNGEHFPNMREAYSVLARTIVSQGTPVSPRGQKTRELLDWSFVIEDPADALPVGVGRKLSLPFAAVEAIQLISGISNSELLVKINPTMKRFLSERAGVLYQHGAYGPRVGPYLEKVVIKLQDDRDSRQAILTVWSPRTDYTETPDVPCTLSLQFMIRDDRLVLMTTMRSNDLWWGAAYDVFQFTQLQLTVAHLLGVEPGAYHHRANSLHVYDRDIDDILDLKPSTGQRLSHYPMGLDGGDTVSNVTMRGQQIITDANFARPLFLNATTSSEQWYYDKLSYVSPRRD